MPARAKQEQRRQSAGGADQVDGGRAGEVLHAEVRLQPATAEDPVRADRVDQRREDDRVDHVGAELDALERRAPHDRQRHGAERELEQPLRLDRRVRGPGRSGRTPPADRRSLAAGAGVPIRSPSLEPVPNAKRSHRVVTHGRDRQVDEDLRDPGADVLAAREADLEQREARLHEQHEDGSDDHPHRVDGHGVAEYLVADGLERVGGRHSR